MSDVFDALTSLNDIQGLIDGGVRESQTLEYKTATTTFNDRDKSEIAKDVSAMANSGGGTIIYGVATDAQDRTRPIAIQAVNARNVETFDRVVNSQIKPPLKWSKKLIPSDADPTIMAIDVQPSSDPPHQSLADWRYYRRSGTESLPMEHDVVALLFGRRLGPLLSVVFETTSRPQTFDGDPAFSNELRARMFVENDGRRVARFTNILLMFQPVERVILVSSGDRPLVKIDDLYPGKQARQFIDNIGVIHPFMRTSITELTFRVAWRFKNDLPREPLITWKVFADEMTPREGSVSLADLGWA